MVWQFVAGALVIARVVPPFLKKGEERHILERLTEQGESIQKEYTPATPECPHPELWKMMDSQTSELEVLDFLKSFVTTIKPKLIVETGTFLGYGTLKMAEGLKQTDSGESLLSNMILRSSPRPRERIHASGLSSWIESRNESSLDTRIEGNIDFLYSDSELKIREQEIRKFLPQLDPARPDCGARREFAFRSCASRRATSGAGGADLGHHAFHAARAGAGAEA